MNHQETIEHYANLKKQKQRAENAADSFFGVLADAIAPFVESKEISYPVAEKLMHAIVEGFRNMPL